MYMRLFPNENYEFFTYDQETPNVHAYKKKYPCSARNYAALTRAAVKEMRSVNIPIPNLRLSRSSIELIGIVVQPCISFHFEKVVLDWANLVAAR